MANPESQPNSDEPYVPWKDPELTDRAKGDVEYFILLVDEARARHKFEEAAQKGVDDKAYRKLQDELSYYKDVLIKYEQENAYTESPEKEPPS